MTSTATHDGPPWKPDHHGIPLHWKGLGSGGNADVWFDGTHAVKRLKRGAGTEAKERFDREVRVVERLRTEHATPSLAIVPVIETREREGSLEILMERLDRNLDQGLQRYRGNPAAAARALVPVAETLASLAARDPAIHHRDVKPSNILFRLQGAAEPVLLLGDFGCAYVAGDDRLTSDRRAVGAWAFRAPEYSGGRVEDVTEKGDVYGLGKVLWAMINGEPGVVFPESLWHLEQYDLARRFDASPSVLRASLLIAGAVHALPNQRPTLRELSTSLRALADGATTRAPSEQERLELLRSESIVEIEHAQRMTFDSHFVQLVVADFQTAVAGLVDMVPESLLFREWQSESTRARQWTSSLGAHVAEHQSDAPVLNVRFRRSSLISRVYPETADRPIRFMVRFFMDHLPGITAELEVSGHVTGPQMQWTLPGEDGQRGPYDSARFSSFLLTAASRIYRRDDQSRASQ